MLLVSPAEEVAQVQLPKASGEKMEAAVAAAASEEQRRSVAAVEAVRIEAAAQYLRKASAPADEPSAAAEHVQAVAAASAEWPVSVAQPEDVGCCSRTLHWKEGALAN